MNRNRSISPRSQSSVSRRVLESGKAERQISFANPVLDSGMTELEDEWPGTYDESTVRPSGRREEGKIGR